MMPTDKELIKNDVVDQLVWDDSVDASHIRVKVSGTTVQLDGTVETYAEKISAAEDAYRVMGVTDVENNLDIQYSTERVLPDDEEITQNVQDSIMWNSRIVSTGIDVETSNRIVTLRGKVATYWEKYEAGNVAQNTYGVLDVINYLEVELIKTSVDVDIEEDIKRALKRNLLIDESKIEVEAKDGVVRLSGTIHGYIPKKEAINMATYTTGVKNVIDDLIIKV